MSPIQEEPKIKIKLPTKFIIKKIIIVMFLVIFMFLLISGMIYVITISDGSYREGDKESTPFAVQEFSDDVFIYEDGSIETAVTVEELWDKMVDDGCRVDDYLDKPEELKKLINAQLITNNLDTRPTSEFNNEIDWDELNKDITSKSVQGIIKLKRNNNTDYLEYTDPATFQSYIDEYNKTGSQEAKNNALTHYTIEKGYVYTDGGNYKIGTDGEAKIIQNGNVIEIPQGQNLRYDIYVQ